MGCEQYNLILANFYGHCLHRLEESIELVAQLYILGSCNQHKLDENLPEVMVKTYRDPWCWRSPTVYNVSVAGDVP